MGLPGQGHLSSAAGCPQMWSIGSWCSLQFGSALMADSLWGYKGFKWSEQRQELADRSESWTSASTEEPIVQYKSDHLAAEWSIQR